LRTLAAVETAVRDVASEVNTSGFIEPMQPVLPHLRHLADGALKREDERAAQLLNEYAVFLDTSANYQAARPYYERALAIVEQVLGPTHPDTARSLNNLASLLYDEGNSAQAIPLMERAVAIRAT
jgi:tetratricopeptide (TPR) repeat protein